jgi:hypothetical protein
VTARAAGGVERFAQIDLVEQGPHDRLLHCDERIPGRS